MKNMKAIESVMLIVLFVILNICQISAQVSTKVSILTFDNALQQVMQDNHQLNQARYLEKEKQQEAKAMNGYYFPKVGATASYIAMDKDLTMDLTPVRNAITPLYSALSNYGVFSGVPNPDPATQALLPVLPDNLSTQGVRNQLKQGLNTIQQSSWEETLQKKQFGVVAATVNWPLFTGGKISAGRQASKIEAKEANEALRQKEGEVLSELVERYYGLCLALQVVKVREDVYSGMEQHLHDAQKMNKEGLIANADLMHAKVYHAQALRDLNQSKHTAETVNQTLLNSLAKDSAETITPASPLFYLDTIESLEYFKMQAEENSPIIRTVESKQALAKQNMKAEISGFVPNVAVLGEYNLADKDLSTLVPKWTVGVGLTWTIFDGMSTMHKTKAAKMKLQQANEAHFKVNSDIQTAANKLYNDLSMYREQLAELDTAQQFAQEYLRLRQKEFHEEMTNSTEVVDAQLALAKVTVDKLQAMYGYDLTLAKLLQYCGIPEKFTDYEKSKDVRTEMYKSLK
jgi:outer membrane protein TolC